jgi:hypothetical protein
MDQSFRPGRWDESEHQKGVSVSGGCPPDSWSVSGGGYWLENDFTYEWECKN